MDTRLTGKKAIVCGASKGLGKACALELAEQGASVTVIARDEDLLAKLKTELNASHGQKHDILAADFSESDELKSKITDYVTQHGPFHILVNNSGGPKAGPVHSATEKQFLQAFTQHLIGNHIMMQSVLEGMKSEKYGRIINIISTSVRQPVPGLGVSNTTRGAVASWSKTLAGELAEFGITVNNVLPGSMETERLYEVLEARANAQNESIEDIIATEKINIPAGRFGEPKEFAQAVAFLAGPESSYINGMNLPVDGGKIKSL